MKNEITKKVFTVVGFLILAFVAINMNACSKDKGSGGAPNDPYGTYGNYGSYNYGPNGGGHLANAYGESTDMRIRLSFSGTNGGQVGATGELWVQGSMACPIPSGRYSLRTVRPGLYMNGDFYQGITLLTNNGIEVFIRGYLRNQQEPNGDRRMTAHANIPGCPTNFF